jgi:uncharacterized membrane protein
MAPSELGPVEIVVVDFDGSHFHGEILPELERLKENGIVRLVDLLVVRKDRSGAVAVLTATDLGLDEMLAFGAKIGAIMGSGIAEGDDGLQGALAGLAMTSTGHVFDEAEAQRLAESIPNDFATAVMILEHRWALPLQDAIGRADGRMLSREWVTEQRLLELSVEHSHNGNEAADSASPPVS